MQRYADEELGRAAGRIWTEGRANPIELKGVLRRPNPDLLRARDARQALAA